MSFWHSGVSGTSEPPQQPGDRRIGVWVGGGGVGGQDFRAPRSSFRTNTNMGASCDKALIHQIPPSFAENPNEDLKYSEGRRPGGYGYTLPPLAPPVIVSLSPYWPSLAGDERAMTAWRASVHRTHVCPAPRDATSSRLPQPPR